MLLPELSTPSAIVDLDKLHRNLNWMASHAQHLGVSLRPHIKTHKSIELAMLQTQTHGGDPSGITVSTFAEASAFADAGFRDITWAVPIPMSRVRQAVDLSIRIGCLNIVVDHHDTVSALEQCAQSQGTSPNVLLKIDCGNHRAGVDPKSEHAMDLASRIARSSHLRFRGVLAHGGHAYACRTMSEVAQVALQERNETVGFAQRLRSVGIAVETVSVGSTPTMAAAKSLSETSDYTTDCATDCAKGFNATGHGVTEIRPGNYALLDVFQATLGVCSLDDIALSVLSTVIGVYPERDSFVIDAGGLALSMDPGPVRIDADCGFGVVRVHVEEELAKLDLGCCGFDRYRKSMGL